MRRVRSDGTLLLCAIGGLEEVPGSDVPHLFSPEHEELFLRHVVWMNDCRGWTFPQIARWLDLIADGTLTPAEALRVQGHADLPPGEPWESGRSSGMRGSL
jgi:hypothetical protein